MSENVHIVSGVQVALQNTGGISGDIYLHDRSTLFQDIYSLLDINRVNVIRDGADSSFIVRANGLAGARFSDLANIARDADRLEISSSEINFIPGDYNLPAVQFASDVVLVINDFPGAYDGMIILSNLVGVNTPAVISRNSGLYDVFGERHGSDLILHFSRNKDYAEILSGRNGAVINNLRARNPNHALIRKLDNAENMGDINKILSRSVTLNPMRMMDAARLIDASRMDAHPSDGRGDLFSFFGGGMSVHGAGLGIGIDAENFSFGVNGTVGAVFGDEYSGRFYGAELYAKYNAESLIILGSMGAAMFSFTTDEIINGEKFATDPNGMSYNAQVNARYYINLADDVYIAPIARIRAQHLSILNHHKTIIAPGAGARFGLRDRNFGIENDFSVYGFVDADGIQYGARAEVFSSADGAGGAVTASRILTPFGKFYKVSVSGSFWF